MNAAEAYRFLEGLQPTQIALGLARMVAVLERLGHPELASPALHVAGTNGKGSVCAMAERAARAAGRKTGFYSSPHLRHFSERLRIAGAPIDEPLLVRGVEAVREAQGELQLTYFEFGTALAFWAFREAQVEVQVLETGLGGRLDATNVCRPLATAITALGLDHTKILGETVAEIAFEKAGILKAGVTCAVARPPPEAAPVLAARAAAVGAQLWIEGRDFSLEGDVYRSRSLTLPAIAIGLRGSHQRQNAAVALALLELASRELRLAPADLRRGVAEANWPGRLQVVPIDPSRRPPPRARQPPAAPSSIAAPVSVEVALDGAHNPPAAEALAAALRELWPGRAVTLIFGVLEDKALAPMLQTLFPLARRALLVAPASPRARPPQTYLAEARRFLAATELAPEERVASALELAIATALPGELVLVCGSLYAVAEGLEALGLDVGPA